MLKITIQVSENKGKDSCDVKIINPKDLSKSSDAEKNTGAMVLNEITKALQNLQK